MDFGRQRTLASYRQAPWHVELLSGMNSKSLVQPLFEGPIDIVGDVHGEIDALHSLMRHLGYDSDGQHPDGRRLVFAGDLTDRGPDSPAVVAVVQRLTAAAAAMTSTGAIVLNGSNSPRADVSKLPTLLGATQRRFHAAHRKYTPISWHDRTQCVLAHQGSFPLRRTTSLSPLVV